MIIPKKCLASLQAEVDKGTLVDRSKQTVAEMMRYWLDTYARHNVRSSTLIGYETTVRVHVVPFIGNVPIQKLTADQLQQLYSDRLAAGCGPRIVQLCHLHISQALKQAVRLGLLQRNVADFVAPPRSDRKEMQVWTVDQAQQFLSVAHASYYGPVWIVMLATGMRRGEVLGLRWHDVDWERGILAVRQAVGLLKGTTTIAAPKTKSSRRNVAVPPEVLAALQEHRARQNERRLAVGPAWQDHGLIFTAAHGQPVNPNNLKRDYNRLVTLAGVPRIRIHDQRHTHVTLALQSGAPLKAVSQRVGHANVSITLNTYAHVMPEEHLEVAARIGAALFAPKTAATEAHG